MFKRLLFSLISIACFSVVSEAQETVSGTVTDAEKNAIPSANVYWLGSSDGTITNLDGRFELEVSTSLPAKIVVSYVGFSSDTIQVSNTKKQLNVVLSTSVQLKEAEVTARKDAVDLSTISTINTATLSRDHLEQAACCNLSESFSTDASVDVLETDAVSGTRKILMLGLDGIYSQVLFENLPHIRGLSSTYGLTYVPGTWIESIQVSKGAGSVVNGFESMSGQINLEYWKPTTEDKALLNLYASHLGRLEANGFYRAQVNDKWSTMLMAHGRTSTFKNDHNSDGFLDEPMAYEVHVFNRWKYTGKRRRHQFGVRFLSDDKLGGQMQYNPRKGRSDQPYYGMGVRTRQLSAFGKTGILFPETPWRSIGLSATAQYHEQKTFFGNRDYDATHSSGFFNGVYQSMIGTTDHTFKTGVSMQADDYQQQFNDSAFNRTEIIPGAFFEYTWNHRERFSMVAGARADYHNLFGAFFTPRLHLKYNFTPLSVVRASGGSGFRSPVLYAENISTLASSRQVRILEAPKAEQSWNTGMSFLQKFTLAGMEGFFNVDYFYTYFENQLVADMDYSSNELLFYNLSGGTYSHSFQVDFALEPVQRFKVKAAYKRYEVKTDYRFNGKLDKPFVPRDRALLNLSYHTKYEIWKFNFTTNWYGVSRIPSTADKPVEFQRPTSSPSYFMLNAQITKAYKFGEFYLGGENLLNYKQKNPIIDAENPFGSNFDASMIWGPTGGTVVYLGFRTTF